jgi:hypothetical protein
MGSVQSTHTTREIKEIPQKEGAPPNSVSGRKQSTVIAENVLVEPHMISTDGEDADTDTSSASESGYDSDYSDEEGKQQCYTVSCFRPTSRCSLTENR